MTRRVWWLQADTEAEETIRESLLAKYPDFQLIGEESYSAGSDKRFLLDKVCLLYPAGDDLNS